MTNHWGGGQLATAALVALACALPPLAGRRAAEADEGPRSAGLDPGQPAAAAEPAGTAAPAKDESPSDEDAPWAATVASEVVPAGRIQVEAGAVYEDRAPGQNFFIETPLLLRFGAVERLELRAAWSPYIAFEDARHEREESGGDALFGARFLTNEQIGLFPSIAIGAAAKAPLADEREGLGSGEADVAARVDATTYWLEEIFYTDLSVQSTWLGQGRRAAPHFYQQTVVEFLAGYDQLAPATLYAQLAWATEDAPGRGGHDSILLSIGGFWFPERWLAFDAGVDIGLGPDDPDWGFYLTVIWMSSELW